MGKTLCLQRIGKAANSNTHCSCRLFINRGEGFISIKDKLFNPNSIYDAFSYSIYMQMKNQQNDLFLPIKKAIVTGIYLYGKYEATLAFLVWDAPRVPFTFT